MSGPIDRTVMWLTWRQLFARRRLWLAIVFALAPLLFTLVFRVVGDDGPESRLAFFGGLDRDVVVGTLLPLAALLFGSTAFGGELDDGTLVYLLLKPVPRWKVLASKLVVAVLSTLAVVAPAVLLPWLVLGDSDVSGRTMLACLAGAAAGAAIYVAIFVALGLANRRALVIGLLYIIAFEGLLSRTVSGLRSFSVREFSLSLTKAAGAATIVSGDTVSTATVWWMGTIMLVGAVYWSFRRLVHYEVAERA